MRAAKFKNGSSAGINNSELSDYARTHSQRNGLKHSMKDSDLPELVTASNRLARGTDAARRLDIRETPMISIL